MRRGSRRPDTKTKSNTAASASASASAAAAAGGWNARNNEIDRCPRDAERENTPSPIALLLMPCREKNTKLSPRVYLHVSGLVLDEPRPAGAEVAGRGVAEGLLEVVERSVFLLDRLLDGAGGLTAPGGAEGLPVEGVVPHLC